jgi:hypothetical protein
MMSDNVFCVTAGLESTTGRAGTIHSDSAQADRHHSLDKSRRPQGTEQAVM